MLTKLWNNLKKMKLLDVVILVTLFVASFIPHGIYAYQLSRIDDDINIVATVSIDGQEVYRTPLDGSTHEEFTLHPADHQYNIIEVDGERIRNREDNSPDQIGVRRGWISQPGETAVVLPHKLIVAVHAEDASGQEINPRELRDDDEQTKQDDIIIPN